MLFKIDVIQDKTIRSMDVEYTDRRLKEFVDNYFSQLQAHLREKGWLNAAYVYSFDEPRREDYPYMLEDLRRFRRYARG